MEGEDRATEIIDGMYEMLREKVVAYSDEPSSHPGCMMFESIIANLRTKEVRSIEETIRSLRGKDGSRVKINRLKRAWYRALARTSNLATDLHWKSIKFLLDSFDVVISPRLNVNDMIGKDSILRAITKRRLAFLCHGKFRERLLMKAMTRGKVILNLEEHGTSRTCSRCGHDNKDIGSSKTLRCEWCHLVIDRDLNASRNHALKSLFGKTTY